MQHLWLFHVTECIPSNCTWLLVVLHNSIPHLLLHYEEVNTHCQTRQEVMQHEYKTSICSFLIEGYLTQWKQNLNISMVTCFMGHSVRVLRYVGLYYNNSHSIGPAINNSQRYEIWSSTRDFALWRSEAFRYPEEDGRFVRNVCNYLQDCTAL